MYDDERVRDAALVVLTNEFRYPTRDADDLFAIIHFLGMTLEEDGRHLEEFDGWRAAGWTCEHCDGRHIGVILTREFVATLKDISLRLRPRLRFGSVEDRQDAARFMQVMIDWFEDGEDALA